MSEYLGLTKCALDEMKEAMWYTIIAPLDMQYREFPDAEIKRMDRFNAWSLTRPGHGQIHAYASPIGVEGEKHFTLDCNVRVDLKIMSVKVIRLHDATVAELATCGLFHFQPSPGAMEGPEPPKAYHTTWSKEQKDELIEGAARAVYFARCADDERLLREFTSEWNLKHCLNDKVQYHRNPWVWVYSVDHRYIPEHLKQ